MTVKDLLDFIEKYKIDHSTILDGIRFVDELPSYYDGYPHIISENFDIVYKKEQKLRFYNYGMREMIYDYYESSLSEKENFDKLFKKLDVSDLPKDKQKSYKEQFIEIFLEVAEELSS